MIPCLRVKPQEMEERLEVKRRELLRCCRGELRGEDSQKHAVLEELEEDLDRQRAQFLPAYEQCFKEEAVRSGLCIGAGSLAVVGMVVGVGVGAGIGIGVAGTVVAVPKGVAIEVGAGGLSLIGGVLGSGVGAWLGRTVARKKTDTNTPGQRDEEEARARGSDQEHLLYGDV